MKLGILVAGVALVLAGCAAQPEVRMVKDGASQQEVAQDDSYCQMQSSYVQTADYEYRGTFMEGANILQKQKKTYALCMQSRGYYQSRI